MIFIFMFSISLTLNFLLILSHHPMMMTLIIVMQTIMICLLINFFSFSLWFSYILFLTFLGGMLILFIYITSLAPNEKFKTNFIKSLINLSLLMILTFTMIFLFKPNSSMLMNQDSMNPNNLDIDFNSILNLNTLYNKPNYKLNIMMMIYLLITLLIAVYISNPKSGALRQSF
uniref:NADH-ubiquinone oxidoreductase chain 6 n=1 Tax=Svistella anhuiensis TaxID=2152901 RepID=A0A856TAP2_9ORTH|nr:NADH dehydrogenase subunit 6 [Svistella anhuiensis]QFG38967.1 NADH dehydrogenase subunit 6 [Svistella anhuiensis]